MGLIDRPQFYQGIPVFDQSKYKWGVVHSEFTQDIYWIQPTFKLTIEYSMSAGHNLLLAGESLPHHSLGLKLPEELQIPKNYTGWVIWYDFLLEHWCQYYLKPEEIKRLAYKAFLPAGFTNVYTQGVKTNTIIQCCQNPNIVDTVLGIGPAADVIKVCSNCKQEIAL